MKIFTVVSSSHEPLVEQWLASLRSSEQFAEPYVIRLEIDGGTGDYGNEQWMDVNRAANQSVLEILRVNKGKLIGLTGVDVRFFRPFTVEIGGRFALTGVDVMMQDERGDGKLFNPDVMFVRPNNQVVSAWEEWTRLMFQWDGNLPNQNRLMRDAFDQYDVRLALLPLSFSNPVNGGANNNPILFHANNIPPPNSVEKKVAALKAQ